MISCVKGVASRNKKNPNNSDTPTVHFLPTTKEVIN